MPTPTNAPTSTTGGHEVQNPELFAQLTERQAMPQASQVIKGLGKMQRLILEKVGVVARVRLLINIKFKTAAGQEPILNPGFPWKILREIALQANGVTGIIDVGAVVLEQRRRRVYRNPVSAINQLTGKSAAAGAAEVGVKLKAAESFTARFAIEIPVAHDMLSLIGCLLAQNEETGLSFQLNWATEEEIVNGGKIEAFEGEVEWATTTFSIGSTVVGKQEVTVLPDLSAFHGMVQSETALVGTGQRRAELIRTAGQLLCYTSTILNKAGGLAVLSPLEWTRYALEYGGNKDPLVWQTGMELFEENADDYDGPLNVAGMTFLAIDNERDNPARDMIIPESLTELRSVIGVPAAFVPENAIILTTQETLYPAV
jgi:hypothetical protein